MKGQFRTFQFVLKHNYIRLCVSTKSAQRLGENVSRFLEFEQFGCH